MFSELVDAAVQRSGRVDRRSDVISFANQTIREMQSRKLFYRNLVEDQITVTADPHIMTRPARLQRFRTARYSDGSYPEFMPPGRAQRLLQNYYYAASTYYVFKGPCAGETIDIAYYQHTKPLVYYADGERPAVYDTETEEWSYLDATTEEEQEVAREKVTNWVLTDWRELTLEGVLAKLFKAIKDTDRAATHFSFFERAYEAQFLTEELHESMNA